MTSPLLTNRPPPPMPAIAERERRKRTLPDWQEPTILHRDGMILIIDKPFGLPAHPGPNPRGQRLLTLSDYLEGFRFGLPRKPEAAHRLDKDTSGCLVLGRHPKALKLLNDLFRDGKVAKTYWAVVEGAPEADEGVIDKPLAKLNPDRGWWMRVDDNGLPSVTRWKVLAAARTCSASRLTFLELSPETGPHPSVARALPVDGLADPRRSDLWQGRTRRRSRPASARPARSRSRCSATSRRSA